MVSWLYDERRGYESGRSRAVWIGASVLVFAISLTLPAFHAGIATRQDVPGWSAFVLGWVPALFNIPWLPRGDTEFVSCLAWFSNPLLLACWMCIGANFRSSALVLASGALAVSLVFIGCDDVPVPDNDMKNVTLGLGYWVWVSSMVIALFCALLARLRGALSSRTMSG